LESRLRQERIKESLPSQKQLPFAVFCDVIGGAVLDVRVSKMMPSDLMREFAKLVKAMQMTATYVLVDGVDEFTPLDKDSSLEGQFVRPLLELMLLETPNVAFKFFFPSSLGPFVKDYIRDDRVDVYAVNWTEAQLMEILHRRLATFSEGHLSSLAAISQSDIINSVDEQVVQCAQGLPRNLIRFGAHLFRTHVARARGEDVPLLSRADLEVARQGFVPPKD
jgi:hypothetical protein